MNKNTTLEINLNEEYKIKIENGNDFNNSIFKEVYESALKNVIEIVKQSDKNQDNNYDDFNNIIAFTGERGKGKSSSMISFRDALINKKDDKNRKFFENFDYYYISDKSFASIDIIDPSFFRGEESLFEIILAKMFQKFQDEIQFKDSKITQDEKRALIQHFQNVFENLQIINSDRKDLYKKESIEALSKLATSSNLRDSFKKLISYYLRIFENNKNYLVIAIDDFDLNFSNTFLMLEDLRRFFIQTKIIILISSNKDQLFSSIYNTFNNEIKKEINSESIKNRTSKYIEKLIPISRTIELPSFTIRTEKKIIDIVEIKKNDDIVGKYPLNINDGINNFYDFLIFYLSSKLDMFIANYEFRQNLVIPKTLREIKEIIQNVEESDFEKFKKYIYLKSFNELIPEYSKLFVDTEENKSISLLMIEQFIIDNFKEFLDPLLIEYIDTTNSNHLSIGDIITLFESFDNKVRISNVQVLKFIDFVKIYLSLIVNDKLLKNSNKFIYNGFSEKLPKEYNIRRDWVKFNIDTKISDYRNNDSVFIIYSLIHIYGDSKFDYRKSNNNYFFRFFENFNQGILNPFSIFTNFLEIKKYIINNKSYSNLNNLIYQYDDIFIKRLNDPSFAKEIVDNISNYAFDYRDKQPDYFNLIYLYIYRGGLLALEKMNKKNEYFVDDRLIESFKNFPIFKLWENELLLKESFVRTIINDMYDSSKPENPNKKNLNEINNIISMYLNRDLTKSRTRTNLKNKIFKIDPKSNIIRIIDDFSKFYKNRSINQNAKNIEFDLFKNKLARLING